MKFTHTRNNGLASFLVCMNTESWVFLCHFSKSDTHLLLVGLSFWFNRNRYRWIWEVNGFKMNWVCRITNCCTSDTFFESNHSCNIASTNFADFFTFISKHTDNTTDTFLFAS